MERMDRKEGMERMEGGRPSVVAAWKGLTKSPNRCAPSRTVALQSLLSLLSLLSFCHTAPTHAQDLVETLRRQRLEARLAEAAREVGEAVPLRPPMVVPRPHDRVLAGFEAAIAMQRAHADSVARARADSVARSVRLGPISWFAIAAHEQGEFLERYREVYWMVVDAPAASDSVSTPELRGRLARLAGAPTRNAAAAEQEGYAGSEYVQFEYWLVANDSIPLLVMDVNGPFGRGMLVAGDDRYQRWLPALKADLAARVLAADPPAPYADYYHSRDRDAWFRTGFDGLNYFTEEVRTPRWARRPREGVRWRIYR
jgi:hypothetical protein